MKKLAFSLMIAAVAACGGSQFSTNDDELDSTTGGTPEPPMAGVHWAKGEHPDASGSAGSGSNLIYHLGPILTSTSVTAIYWGSSWTSSNYKISGLAGFYQGLSASAYGATNTEYTDSSGTHVGSATSYNGSIIDNSNAPRHGNRVSPIAKEVCATITNPVPNGYYPVYVDTRRGNAGFCAWHSYATCNGVTVQIAFFFNLDGDPGCDPQDSSSGHPQGLAALGNVSGHEWSEAITDPHLNAWYDASGAENADKCAWTFNKPVTLNNGTQWKIQGNWSNAANNGGTGYALSGCIDGN